MLSWKRLSTTLLAIGATAAAGACGDNVTPTGPSDAAEDIDAEVDEIDAMDPPPDAGPDAMLDVYTGTITILEVSILGVPSAGQGIQVAASFYENGGLAPVYEESPGSILGCKVFEYTPAQAADVGLNEGSLAVTIDNDAATAGNQGPAIPGCIYVPTRGYMCPDIPTCLSAPGATCVGGTLKGVPAAAPPTDTCVAGVFQIEDLDAPFTFAVTDGRYVSFVGTGTALLPDGTALPVVNKLSDSAIVIPHSSATTDCPGTDNAGIALSATALHLTLGGAGPQAVCATGNGCPDPGMMNDDASIVATFTAGGDNDIPTFTNTVNPGNDFSLTALTQPTFASIPQTGAAFTIGCDATTGCTAGSGDGVVLNIVTTDGSIAGLSPLAMPPPTTKRVQIRCSGLAATSITVPAEASAYLQQAMSGATRIQATFIRGDLDGSTGTTHSVNLVSGHAITTFKTVTECNDGQDNDADTLVDFPLDLGCSSAADTTETGP